MLEKPIDNLLLFGCFWKVFWGNMYSNVYTRTTIMYIDCLIKYQLTDRLSIINIPPIPNHYFFFFFSFAYTTSPAAVMKLVVFFRSSKPPYNFWWSGVADGHCAIRSCWFLLQIWRTCSVVWSSSPIITRLMMCWLLMAICKISLMLLTMCMDNHLL